MVKMNKSVDTAGKVWHPAPFQSASLQTGSIQGVWLFPGERVSWNWMHLPDGKSYISGFSIQNPLDAIKMPELPKTLKESFDQMDALKKQVVDSMGIPNRPLDDSQKKGKK